MFIQPANEGMKCSNSKQSLTCLELSSMGTNTKEVVAAGFYTAQKSPCLHRLQAALAMLKPLGT